MYSRQDKSDSTFKFETKKFVKIAMALLLALKS